MRILVHFPTKGRKEIAERTLAGYIEMADNPTELELSLACNTAADVPEVSGWGRVHNKEPKPFRSKIHAYNAPLPDGWDILVVASDDMRCIEPGWDTIIRQTMEAHFPNTDGDLWFHDGRQDEICTMPITGRLYYQRTGRVYHGSYLSFYCDNERTEVAMSLGKLHKDTRCLFIHEHPAWGGDMPADATYKSKNKDFKRDKAIYHHRKSQGFPA